MPKPIPVTIDRTASPRAGLFNCFLSKNFLLIFLVSFFETIISLVALIIILDTFQSQLNFIFPELELILFNLYETIKDIYLFLKDLIK